MHFEEMVRDELERKKPLLSKERRKAKDPFALLIAEVTYGTCESTQERAGLIERYCAQQVAAISIDQAKSLLDRLGSFDIAQALASLKQCMRPGEWWPIFGKYWTCADDAAYVRDIFYEELACASSEDFALAMSDEENARIAELPDVVPVYWGCYHHNMGGLSWSLSREIASSFPTLARYMSRDKQALLLTGRVHKRRIILKLDRHEEEVLSADVDVLNEELL